MKTTIYITRHGQTEWNVEKKLQGHQDSPLTELGVKQAQWLGEALEQVPIDYIYSSSSPRALLTAELIRQNRPIAIKASDELREINLGLWEGQRQDVLKETEAEQFGYFWNDPDRFGVEQSETFQEVSERAVSKLMEIAAEHEGSRILLVTHTVVVKLLMAHFEGRAMKNLWELPYIHPTCLSKVEMSHEGSTIVLHGDISHYKEQADFV